MLIGDFPRAIDPAFVDACSNGPVLARCGVQGTSGEKILRQWVTGEADVARQARGREEPVSQGVLSRLKVFMVNVGQVVLDGVNRLLGKGAPETHVMPQVVRDSGAYDAPWDSASLSALNRMLGTPSPGAQTAPQLMHENRLYASGADISSPPALPERNVKTPSAVGEFERAAPQSRPGVSRSDVPWYSLVSDVPRLPPSVARQGPTRPLEPAYASVAIEDIQARNPGVDEPIYEEIGERTQPPEVSEDYAQPRDSLEGPGPMARSALSEPEPADAKPAKAILRQEP